MSSEDQETLLTGSLTEHLDTPNLHRIENAVKDAGFDVNVNFAEGTFTITDHNVDDADSAVQKEPTLADEETKPEPVTEDAEPADGSKTEGALINEQDRQPQSEEETETVAEENSDELHEESKPASLQEERAQKIIDAMQDQGWMEKKKILEEALDGKRVWDNVYYQSDRLQEKIESRPHPDDGRKSQYRIKSKNVENSTEVETDDTDIHPDYVADCPHCDYSEGFQDTTKADDALETHLMEEHAQGDEESANEAGDPGKNRTGTRPAET